jgi:predicted short-subunit dehydrogenase-like oxidoreductase (DUF2520 family)
VIGPGRAGRSLAAALAGAGWSVSGLLGRDDDTSGAASGVDLVVVATPDGAVASVAAAIEPVPGTVVAHLAGSLGLDALEPHPRRAAVHPLVSLPDPEIGARRLRGAWYAIAGDAMAREIVAALEGRSFTVADADRAVYHAAAAVASNHLVVLLGQVERLARRAGVPMEAYLDLVRATVDNVAELGAADALTGPAARGDEATLRGHVEALAPEERPLYEVLAAEARRMAACR